MVEKFTIHLCAKRTHIQKNKIGTCSLCAQRNQNRKKFFGTFQIFRFFVLPATLQSVRTRQALKVRANFRMALVAEFQNHCLNCQSIWLLTVLPCQAFQSIQAHCQDLLCQRAFQRLPPRSSASRPSSSTLQLLSCFAFLLLCISSNHQTNLFCGNRNHTSSSTNLHPIRCNTNATSVAHSVMVSSHKSGRQACKHS